MPTVAILTVREWCGSPALLTAVTGSVGSACDVQRRASCEYCCCCCYVMPRGFSPHLWRRDVIDALQRDAEE